MLDIVVDEQGRPVFPPVAQDLPGGDSPLSPAKSIQALHGMITQAAAKLPCLTEPVATLIQQTTVAQAHAALLTEHIRVHDLLSSTTEETARFQKKMLSSIAEENTRFQQFHKELSIAPLWEEENKRLQQMAASLQVMKERAHEVFRVEEPLQRAMASFQPLIESRWKEDQERAHRLAASFQPLIDSQWTEAQERLQTLGAPLKAIHERVREASQLFQPFQQEVLQVQKKLQELAAPFQVYVQDLKTRLQPFLDRMASKAFQKRAQRASDTNTILGAYCPIYRERYPDYQQEDRLNAALTRLIAQLHPGLRKPCAAEALRQQAAAQHTSPQDFLRTVVFPEAIRLVAREVTTPQRMRLGRKWVTNRHGKILVALPEELPPFAFDDWFFSQVYAAAAAIVLGEVYPRPTTQQAQVLVYEEDALERLTARESSGARDSAMLTALLQAEEIDPVDQLHRVLTVASPRARELFRLVSQGLSIKEAAAVLGMSRSTAYVHCYRTRAKGRRR
jgi:DNA-directed RNA polymerase specialized sigma24 family protein